jgi:RNA polymerase sigma factor (sigma-70 family)
MQGWVDLGLTSHPSGMIAWLANRKWFAQLTRLFLPAKVFASAVLRLRERGDMPERKPSPIESASGAAVFATTRWSLVLRAGDSNLPQSSAALETLCRLYWPPLYAFVRRRGYDVHESQDLIQAFIVSLLERRDLSAVSPDKGKFRSFLLAALNHFLLNQWNRSQTQKRGGGKLIFSLDMALAEGMPGVDPAVSETPEKEFERRWAETVIQNVLKRLREEWERRYQSRFFDDLKVYLLEERGSTPFAVTAQRMGITESALKSIVHRLRKRFRELFREEIAGTVEDPSQVEDEIRHLFAALG